MELVAKRSAKVAYLLEQNPRLNLETLVNDIPANPETIDIVISFCRGYEPALSFENVIPITCLAFYLEMTETHSNNNLIKKSLTFFDEKVLTGWNETIKALRFSVTVLPQAESLGLIDACLQSLAEKALISPRLVEKSEDLTTLSLQLYCMIIHRMNENRIPPEYVARSVCLYTEKWVFLETDNMSMYKKNLRRDVIEAIERLLPDEKGLIPCKFLFEILKYAVLMDCSFECRRRIEERIGKQLDKATVKDLLIPSQGYMIETKYDIECVRRILKHFYGNYTTPDSLGFIPVAQLIEDFLNEVATDVDLRTDTFFNLAEMSVAVSLGLGRNLDGIYRAVDIYFDRHRYLTEDERNEVCKILDCRKMSPEACHHAATNERLPLRFVVQVLFVAQLQIRETLGHKVEAFGSKSIKQVDEEKGDEADFDEEEVRADMAKMSIKVMELEKKCYVLRKEIENGKKNSKMKNDKKEKSGVWKDMKRKLGCISSSINDTNCHIKKKKKF